VTGKIRKEDIEDLDVLDRDELVSFGSTIYKSGVSVTSTTTGTNRVVISSFNLLLQRETPVEVGDKATLTGTSGGAGDGTFTIAAIIDANTFDVTETIGTSTGGSAAFKHPSGSSRVGFDPTGLTQTSATDVQQAIKDHDSAIGSVNIGTDTDFLLENEPPEPNNNYANTITAGVVTQERWRRQSDSTLIKTVDYTYSAGRVATEVRKVYAMNGTTVIGQTTRTYTHTGQGVTWTLVRDT
jgi:hypothetical protein